MNFRELMVVACAGLTLAGCANGKINLDRPFQTEPAAPASAGDQPLRQAQIPLDRLLRSTVCNEFTEETGQQKPRSPKVCGEQAAAAKLELTELMARVAKTPTKDQTRIRNEVVGQLLFSSTANCNVYLQSVRNGQVVTRTGSDFLSSLMGFLGSIATTEADAGMFAGLSGLSTAIGASADRNIFAEVGVELIADEIYKIRAEQRARIEGKLGLSYASWPIGLAMTDIYEFHGSCSLLKGLSAMRTAVATRDAAVKAARGAAVEAARAGGDGNTVAAAVVGVEQAFSTSRGPDRPAAGLSPVGLANADLEGMQTTAMACLSAAQNKQGADLAAAAAGLIAKVAGDCKPVTATKPEWELRYVAFAREEITNASQAIDEAREIQRLNGLKIDAVSAEAEAKSKALAAQAALAASPADIALQQAFARAQQTEQQLTQARQAAEAAANAAAKTLPRDQPADKALANAFAVIESRARQRIQADMSYVGGVRAAVVQYGLTAGEQGATAAQVVQGQRDTAGALADRDPVIIAMISAARTVADNPGNASDGVRAARAAQAQGQVLASP